MPPENDFAKLRRLLKFKSHEQPPPGYFENFPKTVVAVLRAERSSRARANESENVPLWVARLVALIQSQPAFAGMVGAAICALGIGGVLLYERETETMPTITPLLSEVTPVRPPEAMLELPDPSFQPVSADTTLPLIASNNLPLAPGSSVFEMIPPLDTAPVEFR